MISDAAHRDLRLACETPVPREPAADACFACGRSHTDPRGCDTNFHRIMAGLHDALEQEVGGAGDGQCVYVPEQAAR